MSTLHRIQNILRSPASEWRVIEREAVQPMALIVHYLAPIAVAAALASMVGTVVVERVPFPVASVVRIVVAEFLGFVGTTVLVFAMALMVNELSPHFGGRYDFDQALKVIVYSYTPILVARLAEAMPLGAGLVAFIGTVYALYVFHVGLEQLMRIRAGQTVGFVVILCLSAIVMNFVLRVVMGRFLGAGLLGARIVS